MLRFSIFFVLQTIVFLEFAANDQNAFPRDFQGAISMIHQKNEYFKSIQTNKAVYDDNVNILTQVINAFTDLSSLQKSSPIFPNLTQSCLMQIIAFSEASSKRETWALGVIDSFGKPPTGIMQGSFLWTGGFNQCRNITVPSISFQGKYCNFKSPTATPFAMLSIGLCVPQQCSQTEIAALVSFAIENIPENITSLLPITLPTQSLVECKVDEPLDGLAIFAIVVLSVIGLIVLVATIFDLYQQHCKTSSVKNEELPSNEIIKTNEPLAFKILKSFSFYTNAKKVFTISNNNGDQFQCLNAIRVLSLCWVILGHTYLFQLSSTNDFSVQAEFQKRFSFLVITNALFSVDTFFVLSGFLTCFLFLKEASRSKQKMTVGFILKYYLHRYLRLTPAYAIVLMIDTCLTGYLGTGPYYPIKDGFELNKCRETWWSNLIYINNLFKVEKMCLGVSWYLANDMQFHWIAPIVLIPFALKKKTIAFITSSVIVLASVLSIIIILATNPGTEAGIFSSKPVVFQKLVYDAPWARIGPFIIGILLGYFIFAIKTKEISNRLTLKLNIMGWFISLFMVSILVFGLYPDFNGYPLSRTAHIFYQAFSRISWAVALGFMIYSCVNNQGGFINQILSWTVWVPLARLSYSAYLIHQLVLVYYYNTLHHPIYLQDQALYYQAISHVVMSYTGGFLISTFFEAPFIGLEKFLLGAK